MHHVWAHAQLNDDFSTFCHHDENRVHPREKCINDDWKTELKCGASHELKIAREKKTWNFSLLSSFFLATIFHSSVVVEVLWWRVEGNLIFHFVAVKKEKKKLANLQKKEQELLPHWRVSLHKFAKKKKSFFHSLFAAEDISSFLEIEISFVMTMRQ